MPVLTLRRPRRHTRAMAKRKAGRQRPTPIADARKRITERLSVMRTGELKKLAKGSTVGWRTMYRIGQGTTPDPHVGALEEIERILP